MERSGLTMEELYTKESERCSPTRDLQPHQIISYMSKRYPELYRSDKLPKTDHISFKPDQVDTVYGWMRIISPEKRWSRDWQHCYVLAECTGCGEVKWISLGSLKRGKSKGCQRCSQPRQIPKWLDRRLTAAKQRCENPKDAGYPKYGARGIRFEFESVTAAGLYLMSLYKDLDRGLEIDRIDTNKGYAPGNLRMVPRAVNQANRRITVLSEFDQKYWPYAETTTRRKLSEGLTRDQIIEDARQAVRDRRKNWKRIAEKLRSMTYEMPESIIVTPYKGTSFITADMAAE